MTDQAAREKWNRIYGGAELDERPPVRVLAENGHLLPTRGQGLEIACGLGANALFLARHGLEVTAWDISDVAAGKLNAYAAAKGLTLKAAARDVVQDPPEAYQYDVIVISHYLERQLCPAIETALRPGGLLYYQTFTRDTTPTYTGPSNPDFRLAENELLKLFPNLVVRVYREEGLAGDLGEGLRNEAVLVGEKS